MAAKPSQPTKATVSKKQPPLAIRSLTTPTPVLVDYVNEKDEKVTRAFTLPAGTSHVIAELKRQIDAVLKISPVLQRLVPRSGVDSLSPVTHVELIVRKDRRAESSISVKTLKESIEEIYPLKVATDDTILDVKFLVAPKLKIAAEYIRLYLKYPGVNQRVPLSIDSKTLAEYQVPNGSVLKVMYEVPSIQEGHGNIHKTRVTPTRCFEEGVYDVGRTFRNSVHRYGARDLFGVRSFLPDGKRGPYVWQTYAEIGARVTNFGAGLRAMGLHTGDRVGIMSGNRTEWLVSDYACCTQSFISVPLYDTLGANAVEFIIGHAAVKVAVVNLKQLKQVLAVRGTSPTLKRVVVMDDDPSEKKALQSMRDDFVVPFSAVENEGKKVKDKFPDVLPAGDDIFTICYTSGTTGNPKGAVIKHSQMIAAIGSFNENIPTWKRQERDCSFSYLPLAHIYERVVQLGGLLYGNCSGFNQGDILKLVEDVAELKPTAFPGVPRVWQRVYDRITAQIESSNFIRRAIFHKALTSKLAMLHAGDFRPSIWDKIVFKKVAERFGGNVKMMVTGAAPLSSTVAEFLRVTCMVDFIEGYGMTETCAGISNTPWDDCTYGIVGLPVACTEIKLVDVPDMEYYAANDVGEIWVRGPNIFSGYYLQPEATAEVLDSDGWMATGDIGVWLPCGSLKIIDRKKNLFKLAQGEYISPEKVEGVYKECPLIATCYVHGESTENYLVSIVVVDPEAVKEWTVAHVAFGLKGKPISEVIQDKRFVDAVKHQMNDAAQRERLTGFEVVKKFILSSDEFTVEEGLVTPTMKLRRHALAQKFAPQIKQMYSSGDNTAAAQQSIKAKL